jgi:hypothetical protein
MTPQGMRGLVALVVLGAIATILWFFYSALPHPLGTLGYDYLHEFPGFLGTLVTFGVVLVLRMVFRSKKMQDFTRVAGRKEVTGFKSAR